MTRYAQNGGLTRFDTGSTHEQNPLSGIPIGNNNSVEENETKSGDFVYSNRIFLDSDIVSQYNLPKSLVGKSVADATKMIDDKFKGRNDKISQSTKNGMLSKIAEAQEAMKPQEPEMEQPQEGMEQSQMAYGGSTANRYESGQQLGDTFVNGAAMGADMIMPGSGQILKLGDQLGQTAGQAIGGDKGESIGGLISPLGTIRGLGSALKTGNINDIPGVGIFSGQTTKQKAILENANNSALNTNKQFSDKYALGGELNPPVKQPQTGIIENNGVWDTKKIVKYQPSVTHGANGEQGFYLYSKDPTLGGFNVDRDREFIRQENLMNLQRTPQWQEYMATQKYTQPIKQMADGGYYDKNNPYFMRNPGPTTINPTIGKTGFYGPDILPKQVFNDSSESINIPEREIISTQTQAQFESYANQQTPIKSSFGQKVGKVGNYVNENAGNLARYAPIATNALQLAQLKKPQGERLDRLSNRYKPEYVDEATLQNIADQTMNNTISSISQSGASQGQNRASILGSQLQRTKAISDAYSQAVAQNRAINDRAQTFNADIDRVNLNQSNNEKDINARDQAAYRNAKREYITGIGEGIGDIGKEQVQKKMISTATGYTYDGKYVKSPDGNIVIDPDTKEPMTGEKMNTLQATKNVKKQALGGYLIKNRVK